MADRFWVGGSGTWDTTSTTNWSATSGGASGASVPTAADSVFFDQAGTYTVTMTGALACLDFTVSAGAVTFAGGTTPSLAVSGSMTIGNGNVPSWSITTLTVTFNATTTGKTITLNNAAPQGGTNGVFNWNLVFNGIGGGWTFNGGNFFSRSGATCNITAGTVNVQTGGNNLRFTLYAVTINGGTLNLNDANTFTCSSVSLTSGTLNFGSSQSVINSSAGAFSTSGTTARTLSLGSSTISFVAAGAFWNIASTTNLTFSSGTSTINDAGGVGANPVFTGGGLTYNNISLTSLANSTASLTFNGANTFNNVTLDYSFLSAFLLPVNFSANQTISGTLTLTSGGTATKRAFLRSDTLGATRTLTCAAVSATDTDFRDITIAGAAAPASGTRLGDCKGNSGITFPAAKTVWFRATGSANWGVTGGGSWSLTNGGAFDATAFPLAQDTAVFPSATYPASGSTVTLNAAYNIGTIDMSARTSNTMTLATGGQTPSIYGNWINGTGITLTGTGTLTFAGRGSQTITSAGKTFTQAFTIDTPSGSVTLQDAFTTDRSNAGAITLTSGTLDANTYNVTLSGSGSSFVSTSSNTRTIAVGSGTWTIAGAATGGVGWNTSTSTNLTVTGTGTISLTSASAKTFAGGGIQTYPTLNQGGTGTLTVTGSNKFANITNTAIGRVQFTGGTTNEFTSFSLNGTSTAVRLALGSTNTTQTILRKPTAWNVGTGSLDGGNNTGLSFTAGTNDFLSISYINGQISGGAVTHTTTGALPGLTAAITGSAARFRAFGASGALVGPGALVVGSSIRFKVFTSSGALTGSGSVVLGLSTRFRTFDSTGALVGPGSTVTGASIRYRAFDSTGALVGPGSVVTGDSNRFRAFNATGDLFGAGSLISGAARRYRVFDTSGEIPGVLAEVVGTAHVKIAHVATGNVVGPGAQLTGASVLIKLYPDPSDVREGVQYGPGGMYVGTLTVVDGQTIIRIRSITERL